MGRLFCQRALWQRDPQRVTKFLLLSARDQFRKRMNEQGGLVTLNFSFLSSEHEKRLSQSLNFILEMGTLCLE